MPRALREKRSLFPRDAERQRVHQRILRIARLKAHFPADGRHAKTISVMRDAANHAIENAAILRDRLRERQCADVRDGPEAQRIEHRDGPRAHGENIAQNAADAGGRALKRLDEAGMIVRFDFEGRDQAIADIDDAGIFSRALHHQFAASAGASDAPCCDL